MALAACSGDQPSLTDPAAAEVALPLPLLDVAPSTSNVQPREIAGNLSGDGNRVCAAVAPAGQVWFGVKQEGFAGATLAGFQVTVTNGKSLAWTTLGTTNVLRAVVIKGGPNTHVYDYNPAFLTSDAGLRAPLNGGGNVPTVSHYVLCYQPAASASGVKFSDRDADGAAREPGEPGLAGWTFYVDYDGDGVLDANEPRAVSGPSGAYRIVGIAPGSYTIREVGQTGWTCSFPGTCSYPRTFAPGQSVAGNDFGNHASGFLVLCKRPDASIPASQVGAYFGNTTFTFTLGARTLTLSVNRCTTPIPLPPGNHTVAEKFQLAPPGRGIWWASSASTTPASALVSFSNPIVFPTPTRPGADAVAVVKVATGQTTTLNFFNIDP